MTGNDRSKYYSCSDTNEGSNVISAAFDTKALTMVGFVCRNEV